MGLPSLLGGMLDYRGHHDMGVSGAAIGYEGVNIVRWSC